MIILAIERFIFAIETAIYNDYIQQLMFNCFFFFLLLSLDGNSLFHFFL